MTSAGLRVAPPLAGLSVLLAAVAAIVLPAPPGALGAGLVAAVLVILLASTVGSTLLVGGAPRVGMIARTVLQRAHPRPAQSDPDARGHARPRAPGFLSAAV
jgi:Family of unknown function (DUF6412)